MASITLDFEARQIAPDLEPDLDDLGRINTVVVARHNGSQFTDTDTNGPLGTTAIGVYRSQVDINPESDSVLPQHAHYHLVLGTDPDPRYPQVTVELTNASPEFTAEVAALDVGDLITLENLPEDLGQSTIDLLILGYTEIVGSHTRRITFNCRQGGILTHVGMLDGDAEATLQTTGAELGTAITAEQVTFNVVTTSGPSFTTSPPAGARIIVRDREVMTVTGVTALRDTFTRSVAASSWGTSDSGHTYQLNSTGFSVNGTQGVIALSALNDERHATALVGAHGFVDVSVAQTLAVTPTGAGINWGILLRYTDVNNYYWADVQVQTTSVLTLRLVKRVSGVATSLTTVTAPITHSTSVPRVLRAMYDPSTGTFASRIWSSDAEEPTAWQLSTTDSAVPAGTRAGVIARLMTGNTNVQPVNFAFDNLVMNNPQEFTVTRDPDQRMAHPDASDVRVYRPLRLVL